MATPKAIVIGAGIGGLAAAVDLARSGLDVHVIDRATGPGGKLAPVRIAESLLDAGPTVFTMKWVFEALFADAGTRFDDEVPNHRLDLLARHAWSGGATLDLHADRHLSAEAIGRFSGAADARGFLAFCERAHKIYRTLEDPFIRSEQPTPISLARGAGLAGLGDLWRISPFNTLWRALGDHFRDIRLRQLFGRYATYNGSSPFIAPATLMLIADVEQQGVWSIRGGMHKLASALEALARRLGVTFRYACHVEEIAVEAGRTAGVRLAGGGRLDAPTVIFNGDAAALATGLLGAEARTAARPIRVSDRSLSAITWVTVATTAGFPLACHNVFFSTDYAREFDTIFDGRRLPDDATIYICAQDRSLHADEGVEAAGSLSASRSERLLCLLNAPADGDSREFRAKEIQQCQARMIDRLSRSGLELTISPETTVIRTPADFERAYPATGGALYGQASHGWKASFDRPSATTRVAGLYLAGGSVHPGAGVPMAALSGRLAAQRVLMDLTSRRR